MLLGASSFLCAILGDFERVNFGQCLTVDLATVLAGAAKQGASRPGDGAALPARVLFAGIALPTLQNPLQRVIDDPPGLVELCYEAI